MFYVSHEPRLYSNSAKYVPPDCFLSFRLKKSVLAGVAPRTSMGSLRPSPSHSIGDLGRERGEGTPSPFATPLASTLGVTVCHVVKNS